MVVKNTWASLENYTHTDMNDLTNAVIAAYTDGDGLGTPASGNLGNCTALPLSGLAAASVVTASETLASNNNDTTVPTSAAVKGYVDSATKTLTNTRLTPRQGNTTSAAQPVINTDNVDIYRLTAQAAAINTMSTNLTGTPTDGQQFVISVRDNGVARAIAWGASFVNGAGILPLTTIVGVTSVVSLRYDTGQSKWVCFLSSGLGLWKGTQAEYDALGSYDTQTIYILTDAGSRVTAITSSATPTFNTDACDMVSITALAAAITSMTTNQTGTPRNAQRLLFRIKDDGTARAITWGALFEAGSVALPSTTILGKTMMVGFIYDSVDAKWACEFQASRA